MTSHILLLVLFSLLVSAVFAVLLRDDPRAQITTGLKLVGGFVGVGLALGWLLYPMPF
jgi:phosphate/sulfate permease